MGARNMGLVLALPLNLSGKSLDLCFPSTLCLSCLFRLHALQGRDWPCCISLLTPLPAELQHSQGQPRGSHVGVELHQQSFITGWANMPLVLIYQPLLGPSELIQQARVHVQPDPTSGPHARLGPRTDSVTSLPAAIGPNSAVAWGLCTSLPRALQPMWRAGTGFDPAFGQHRALLWAGPAGRLSY